MSAKNNAFLNKLSFLKPFETVDGNNKLMIETGVKISVLLLKLKKLEPNDGILRNFVKSEEFTSFYAKKIGSVEIYNEKDSSFE